MKKASDRFSGSDALGIPYLDEMRYNIANRRTPLGSVFDMRRTPLSRCSTYAKKWSDIVGLGVRHFFYSGFNLKTAKISFVNEQIVTPNNRTRNQS
jgi:hypothetical protein